MTNNDDNLTSLDFTKLTDQEKFEVGSKCKKKSNELRQNNDIPNAIQHLQLSKILFEYLIGKGWRKTNAEIFQNMRHLIEIIIAEIEELQKLQSNPPRAVAEGKTGGDGDDGDELLAIGERFLIKIKPTHGLKQVAGLNEVKDAVRLSILLPLKQPQCFTNRSSLKGVLLYGPPGTGKSFIAKALAADADCETFFAITPADVKNKYVGESEKTIKALFYAAQVLSMRYNKPAIIFIDEIDAIGESRDSGSQSTASTGLLTQLLISMDGMGSDGSKIFVIAASNRPDALDPALMRRMHKRVLIPLPDYEARAQILRQEMGDPVNWELLDDEEIDEIVLMLEGYSGSDIKTICIDALNIPLEEAGRSEYFIKLQGEDGEFYYTPCHELVEGAIRIAFGDVPDKKLQIRPTSSRDLIASINRNHRSVTAKEVKKYMDYENSLK